MKFATAAIACVALGWASAAFAADPWCRNAAFAGDETDFGLAKVTGAPRTYLRDCVQAQDGCQTGPPHVYVVPGNVVITGRRQGAQTCVYFPNRAGGSAGWVDANQIAPQALDPSPSLSSWSGRWIDADDSITLSVKGAAIAAKGDACWPSCNPSQREFPGGPNIGSFDVGGTPAHDELSVVDGADACRVRLRLAGAYLVVSDNNNCGGMNVSFTGVYQRRAR